MSYLELNLQTLTNLFSSMCTSSQIPQSVEDSIMLFREDPAYIFYLLDLVLSTQSLDIQIRAAIDFKNTVTLHWVVLAH